MYTNLHYNTSNVVKCNWISFEQIPQTINDFCVCQPPVIAIFNNKEGSTICSILHNVNKGGQKKIIANKKSKAKIAVVPKL